jgi:PAS domain-containing protein
MGRQAKYPGRIGRAKEPAEIDLAFYKFALDSLPVGIITVNPQLEITSFNLSGCNSPKLASLFQR